LWLILVPGIIGMLIVAAIAIAQIERGMLDDRRAKVRNLVEVAYSVLTYYGELAERGSLPLDEAKSLAAATIKKMRYDASEYFWINDMHPRMVMHPYQPELDGQDVSGLKDPAGNHLFVTAVTVVRAQQEGFMEYNWPKPGVKKPVPKLSYVKGYQPWGWIIGSGIYLDDVQTMVRKEITQLTVITALFLVAGVAIALVLVRNFTAPINELENAMLEVETTHNLSRRAAIDRKDEIGRMAVSFNRMLNGFCAVFSDLRAAVVMLRDASAQLTAITAETRQSVEEQQSGTDQVATAINEMVATIQEVATNAGLTASAAQAATEEAQEGTQVVSTTIEVINGLAQEVEHASQAIHQLEAQSENIGTVLDVIRSVAEQTNLLALNAAIEAARAGDHGRGFAVVADEVRTLAQRTQDSTREIQGLIENLQTSARNAVQVMEEGRQHAENGVAHSLQAGNSLENIVTAVSRINDMTLQTATATEEQSAVSEEINRHVLNIAHMADRTAAGAVSTSSAATELKELAEKLSLQIDRYRTTAA